MFCKLVTRVIPSLTLHQGKSHGLALHSSRTQHFNRMGRYKFKGLTFFFFFSAQEVKKFDDITTRAIQSYVDKLETLLPWVWCEYSRPHNPSEGQTAHINEKPLYIIWKFAFGRFFWPIYGEVQHKLCWQYSYLCNKLSYILCTVKARRVGKITH